MSRDQVAADLRQAQRRVAEGEQIVVRQQNIIAKLEAEGRPTTDARELLKTYEVLQRLYVADRDRLIVNLRAAD